MADTATPTPTAPPELLPCPFCGSTDLHLSNGYDEDANWVVVCRSCKSSGTFCVERSAAIAHWNTRRAAVAAPQGDAQRDLINQFLLDKYACTIEHHRMKVLKHFVEWAASSPVSPSPTPEQEQHWFLQFPVGRFRRQEDDIGKCWQVINHHYCGLPRDADIHQVTTTEGPLCIHCGRRGPATYCGKRRGLQKCEFLVSPSLKVEEVASLPNAPDVDPNRKCWASTSGEVCINPRGCDDRGCQLYAGKDYEDRNTSTNKQLRDELIAAHEAAHKVEEVAAGEQDVDYSDPVSLLEKAMRTTMEIECDCERKSGACDGECVGSRIWQLIHRARKLIKATPVSPSDVARKAAEEVAALKRPPSKQFSVRFVDHIQGSNCAEWECGNCKQRFISAGNLKCPHCHGNEAEPKVTDADAIYNQAIDDALALISRYLPVPVGDERVARSKDVLDAISEAFDELKGQRLPVSEVGFAVYRALLKVPEFYAGALTALKTNSSADAVLQHETPR